MPDLDSAVVAMVAVTDAMMSLLTGERLDCGGSRESGTGFLRSYISVRIMRDEPA